jgi:hypothetical protein
MGKIVSGYERSSERIKFVDRGLAVIVLGEEGDQSRGIRTAYLYKYGIKYEATWLYIRYLFFPLPF